MSQLKDEELVAAILEGATEQYSELVKRYQGRIVNYLYRLLRNVDDAHDLAQEVFLRVFRALDRYNPQYKFSTWLFRVAQNAAIDVVRKRRLQMVSMSPPFGGRFGRVRPGSSPAAIPDPVRRRPQPRAR